MSHQPLLCKDVTRIATAMALLVSVMISPIRPAPGPLGGAHLDCLRRNFGIPGKATTNHRPHVPVTSRVIQVKALSSHNKFDWSPPAACHGVAPACPPSFVVGPEWDSQAVRFDRSNHPLRC